MRLQSWNLIAAILVMTLLTPFKSVVSAGNEDAERLRRFLVNATESVDEKHLVRDTLSRAQYVNIRYEKNEAILSPFDLTNHITFANSLRHCSSPFTSTTNGEEHPLIILTFKGALFQKGEPEAMLEEMQKPVRAGFRITEGRIIFPGIARIGSFLTSSFAPIFCCGCGAGGGPWFVNLLVIAMLTFLIFAFVFALVNWIKCSHWMVFGSMCILCILILQSIGGSAGTWQSLILGHESCHSLPMTIYTLLYDILRALGIYGLLFLPTLFTWILRTPRGHRLTILISVFVVLVILVAKLISFRWLLYSAMSPPVYQIFLNN